VAFHRIAYIAETYSLILAISELNMEVLCKSYPLALAVKPFTVCMPTSFKKADLPRFDLFSAVSIVCYVFRVPCCLDEVLVNTEDMHRLADELRAKINGKIRSWSGVADPTEEQEREVSVVIRCVRVFSDCLSGGLARQALLRVNWRNNIVLFRRCYEFINCFSCPGAVRAPVVPRDRPGRQRHHRQGRVPHDAAQAQPHLQVGAWL
jgi:hypothetical protein